MRDGHNGLMLYHPTKVEELRERIHTAFGVPDDERATMGSRARATMLPLTWDAHVSEWMKAIESLPSR